MNLSKVPEKFPAGELREEGGAGKRAAAATSPLRDLAPPPAPGGWSRMWEPRGRQREPTGREQKAQPRAACPPAASPPPPRRSHTQVKHARKFLPACLPRGLLSGESSHGQEKKTNKQQNKKRKSEKGTKPLQRRSYREN